MSEWQAVMRSGEITIRRRTFTPTPRASSRTLAHLLTEHGQAAATQVRALWAWLERKRSSHFAARRLHLAETLSLGEKRFVSIIEVDGTQYLIGGSSGNVQLLSRLEDHGPKALPMRAQREMRS